MNFLRQLGLGGFLEKENLLRLLRWAEADGKTIKGYSGEYRYAFIKDVAVVLHIENKGGRQVFSGLSSHVKSGRYWTLTRTGESPFRKGEEDALSLWARFQGDDRRRKSIAVKLLFADVLPYMAPGEEVRMQVAAYAIDINYYPDADTWAREEGAVIMGTPMQIAGSVLGKDNGISIIQGTVREVKMREACDEKGDPVLFYAVTVDTCYGELEIFHGADMVSEEKRKYIRVGACLYAGCVIQGDVAVGEYEKGAVYGEENCLKLLEDAFTSGSFRRAEGAFAEGAVYVDGDLGAVRTSGKAGTVKALESILTTALKKEGRLYAYLGRAEKYCGSGEDAFSGKMILALAHTTPAYFREMLAVTLDGENKISSVTVKNVADYSIRIREERQLPVNESSCLELIKNALDSGDCSRLVNYLARDAVFSGLGGIREEGCYGVLDALERFLYYQYENGITVNIFPSRIMSGDLAGKECLGISLGDFDDCGTLLTAGIKDGRIVSVSLTENGYRLSETGRRKKLVPLVTERSASEWLAFFRDWINGAETDPVAFYMGLARDCAVTVDNGKVLETARGREDVFRKMKELTETAGSARLAERMLITPSFSMTVLADARGRIKALRVKPVNVV